MQSSVFMKPRLGFDSLWRVAGVGVYMCVTERGIKRETLKRRPEIQNKTNKKQILKGIYEEVRRRKSGRGGGKEEEN